MPPPSPSSLDVRIVLNSVAIKQILKSQEVVALLVGMGESIATAAGPGNEVEVDMGPNRVRVEVRTDTFEAMRAEAYHRRLTSAIDNGRR
jgi:hypothetical protein